MRNRVFIGDPNFNNHSMDAWWREHFELRFDFETMDTAFLFILVDKESKETVAFLTSLTEVDQIARSIMDKRFEENVLKSETKED